MDNCPIILIAISLVNNDFIQPSVDVFLYFESNNNNIVSFLNCSYIIFHKMTYIDTISIHGLFNLSHFCKEWPIAQ